MQRNGSDIADHSGLSWIYLHCPHCRAHARFTPLHTTIVNQPEVSGVATRDFHSLAVCEHCDDVIYIKCEEIDFDPDWHFHYQYHFPRTLHPASDSPDLPYPESIWQSIWEAHKCLQAGAPLAAVVMCRRTIEAVLHDQGVSSKLTLARGLETVAKNATFHNSMIAVADLIRILGNVGAHAGKPSLISESDASEAYKFTQSLLEMLYVLPARAKDIRNRLESAKPEP
jgi:hypothetical protein